MSFLLKVKNFSKRDEERNNDGNFMRNNFSLGITLYFLEEKLRALTFIVTGNTHFVFKVQYCTKIFGGDVKNKQAAFLISVKDLVICKK